jgi:hypothetical protein
VVAGEFSAVVGGGSGRTYPGVATARGFFDPAAT